MAARDITGAVDFHYLETYAGHDAGVIEEVLALFVEQADLWSRLLDPEEDTFLDAAHTLKGAALGIGARGLAGACSAAEVGDAEPRVTRRQLAEDVRDALGLTLSDIAAYRHQRLLDALRA